MKNYLSKIKLYVQTAPSKGFVSFESISTDAGITRIVLKEHLENLILNTYLYKQMIL